MVDFSDYKYLSEHLDESKRSQTSLSEQACWKIIIELLDALSILHKNSFILRALKSNSVFMFRDFSVKISDLNHAVQRQMGEITKFIVDDDYVGSAYYSRYFLMLISCC